MYEAGEVSDRVTGGKYENNECQYRIYAGSYACRQNLDRSGCLFRIIAYIDPQSTVCIDPVDQYRIFWFNIKTIIFIASVTGQ